MKLSVQETSYIIGRILTCTNVNHNYVETRLATRTYTPLTNLLLVSKSKHMQTVHVHVYTWILRTVHVGLTSSLLMLEKCLLRIACSLVGTASTIVQQTHSVSHHHPKEDTKYNNHMCSHVYMYICTYTFKRNSVVSRYLPVSLAWCSQPLKE